VASMEGSDTPEPPRAGSISAYTGKKKKTPKDQQKPTPKNPKKQQKKKKKQAKEQRLHTHKQTNEEEFPLKLMGRCNHLHSEQCAARHIWADEQPGASQPWGGALESFYGGNRKCPARQPRTPARTPRGIDAGSGTRNHFNPGQGKRARKTQQRGKSPKSNERLKVGVEK